ncbi:MAG TPA: substrate-binding domain-containing protein [Gemmatimonadaceae bacterium]|jgi:molybdate/tungstate transport system substrate-binding protein|nr:substrate-binding domain-containing protein [Gemmatimonadaceae bacterium]
MALSWRFGQLLSRARRRPRAPQASLRLAVLAALVVLAGTSVCVTAPIAAQCSATGDTILVFEAGSLSAPMGAAAALFTARTSVPVRAESGGSVAQARKLTVSQRIPDLIAVADDAIIPRLLMPAYARWYARFARNTLVIVQGAHARGAAAMSDSTWWQVLTRPGVRTGRSDPNQDPGGYRAVIGAQLAEQYYDQPGLARRLLAHSILFSSFPGRPRPDSLLRSGALDYAWSYESYALDNGLHFQRLPAAVNLGVPGDSAHYASASLRVAGSTPGDTVVMRGAPIVYGLTVPERAPHRALALCFAAWLLSPGGSAEMRDAHLDTLDPPELVGQAPAALQRVP